MDIDTIIFNAIVAKVSTQADGGLRLTLDLPESAIPQAAQLMTCFQQGIALRVAIAAAESDSTPEDADA